MGWSVTVNCIGEDKEGVMYTAMTKLEVYQMSIVYPIKFWYAQTLQGKKLIGLGNIDVKDILNNPPKGVISCICKLSCPMCKGSGKTTKSMMNGYRDWQLEEFRNR